MTDRAVALIHGLGSSFEHGWERLGWPELLADEGFAAIPVALPAHRGGRDLHRGEGMREIVADVEAQLAPARDLDVIAFSAGALVTLHLLARGTLGIHSAVLMGLGDRMRAAAEAPDLDSEVWQRLFRSSGNSTAQMREFASAGITLPAAEELGRIAAPVLLITGERDPAGAPTVIGASIPNSGTRIIGAVEHFGLPASPVAMAVTIAFLSGSTAG